MQDVDSWIEAFRRLFVRTLGFIEGLHLGSKDGENGIGVLAGFQLGG